MVQFISSDCPYLISIMMGETTVSIAILFIISHNRFNYFILVYVYRFFTTKINFCNEHIKNLSNKAIKKYF